MKRILIRFRGTSSNLSECIGRRYMHINIRFAIICIRQSHGCHAIYSDILFDLNCNRSQSALSIDKTRKMFQLNVTRISMSRHAVQLHCMHFVPCRATKLSSPNAFRLFRRCCVNLWFFFSSFPLPHFVRTIETRWKRKSNAKHSLIFCVSLFSVPAIWNVVDGCAQPVSIFDLVPPCLCERAKTIVSAEKRDFMNGKVVIFCCSISEIGWRSIRNFCTFSYRQWSIFLSVGVCVCRAHCMRPHKIGPGDVSWTV